MESEAATGSLVLGLIVALGVSVTPDIATCLAHRAHLRHGLLHVFQRRPAHRAARGVLIDAGADKDRINEQLYQTRQLSAARKSSAARSTPHAHRRRHLLFDRHARHVGRDSAPPRRSRRCGRRATRGGQVRSLRTAQGSARRHLSREPALARPRQRHGSGEGPGRRRALSRGRRDARAVRSNPRLRACSKPCARRWPPNAPRPRRSRPTGRKGDRPARGRSDPFGFINAFKPPGPSSAAFGNWVKRAFAGAAVGHWGTLDPTACGVLPLGCRQSHQAPASAPRLPQAIYLRARRRRADANGGCQRRGHRVGERAGRLAAGSSRPLPPR